MFEPNGAQVFLAQISGAQLSGGPTVGAQLSGLICRGPTVGIPSLMVKIYEDFIFFHLIKIIPFTHFEDLSNELIYKIFDFLDMYYIYGAFFLYLNQ